MTAPPSAILPGTMAAVGLSILMPVFDEHATVERAIDDALGAELPVGRRELIVVDDGSTDGTRELLSRNSWPAEVKIVLHDHNLGKGAAIRTASNTRRASSRRSSTPTSGTRLPTWPPSSPRSSRGGRAWSSAPGAWASHSA